MTFTATPEAGKPGIIVSVLLGRTQPQGHEISGSGSQLERKGTGTETSGLARPSEALFTPLWLPSIVTIARAPCGSPTASRWSKPGASFVQFPRPESPRRAGRSHWLPLRLARPSKPTSANERTTTALEPRPCSGSS